jgi:hypothetical protein
MDARRRHNMPHRFAWPSLYLGRELRQAVKSKTYSEKVYFFPVKQPSALPNWKLFRLHNVRQKTEKMETKHIIFLLFSSAFLIPGLLTLRAAINFYRQASLKTGKVITYYSSGSMDGGSAALRPVIIHNAKEYIIKDLRMMHAKIGDHIEVFLNPNFDYGYKKLSVNFWSGPLFLISIGVFYGTATILSILK